MSRKRIPIGKDNFKKLIEGNYYFIDKSLFIKQICDEDAEILLITRPRRFGKTLNMSMLRYFFSNIDYKENKKLFNGLKVEKEKETMLNQGKYPIINFTLKDVKELNWEKCKEKMKLIIQDVFSEFEYLLNIEDISIVWNIKWKCKSF